MTRAPLRVGAAGRGYEVRIEPGGLGRLGEACRAALPDAHRFAVLSDSKVARLYGEPALTALRDAGASAGLHPFPAGEWNKTRTEWARLTDAMLRAGYGRDAAVVALGGGVTGDLAGFVAATYMRGVPVVQVPTSLLAMLDSAVGGKTGVDTEAGKNLVGAFHDPALVLIDPEVLGTLPAHQRRAGLAEAVKTAAILDAELFAWMEENAKALREGETDPLAALVRRVVAHKIRVVERDPRESDLRAILNFGHTVGHALELLGGYEILHGEAVAAGMRVEARIGEQLGVTEPGTTARLAALLAACGLDRPWEAERGPRKLWEALGRDKKARRGRVRYVLLRRIGAVARADEGRHTFAVPEGEGEVWLAAGLAGDGSSGGGSS